ncbi:UspA domain-containing protein [Hyella patelloides LEGE 07179]|uniref:UspA domain-containing protein n=1 Tax=Hyella patelloides LEGE 07179 TaxID=945734 RepID=A0A563VLQ5_9CYAN|nr:universal stress protein [Hyella patelloides]VEP12352.1 UspA domain-containing protein [Hyella patelloides LEGE 07179]
MFQKILVALDRSFQAAAVFDFALSIAQPETSQMLLVHFIDWQMQDVSPWVGAATLYDIDASGNPYDWSRQSLQQEIEQSKSWLENYAQKAIANKISCKFECYVGSCNLGIGDRAKEWDADVIIMGRRGHRNISEILLGSVSNYVIHHAPCSILVVQETQKTVVSR